MLTRHGKIRVRERIGVGKKAAERNVALAKERGLPIEAFSGSLRKYLGACLVKDKAATELYVYGQFVYLFTDGVFLTVIPLNKRFAAKPRARVEVEEEMEFD